MRVPTAFPLLIVVSLCALAGCQKKTPMDDPLTIDRFGRTAEPGPKEEAVTLKEISFLVRAGSANEISGQVKRRGLAEPIDEKAAVMLAGVGASGPLIAALKASPYLLTEPERELYAERVALRQQSVKSERDAQSRWVDGSRTDLNNRIRTAETARLDDRRREQQERISKLRTEQSKEHWSRSSDSPYQHREREIQQAQAEIARINGEMNRSR
jgi:hypothetical protein